MSLGNVFERARQVSGAREAKIARLAQMAAIGERLKMERREAKKRRGLDPAGVLGGAVGGFLTGGLSGALMGGFAGAQGTRGKTSALGEGLMIGATKGFFGGGKSPIERIEKAKGFQFGSGRAKADTELKAEDLKKFYTTKSVQNDKGQTVVAHVPNAAGVAKGFETIYTDEKVGAQKTVKVTNRDEYVTKGFQVATPEQIKNVPEKLVTAADTGDKMIKLRPLSAVQTKAISDIDNALAIQQDALTMMKDSGLKPDPVTGRIPVVGDVINVFTKKPEWQEWQAKVDRAFQMYRKIVTGAQASDKEIARLVPLMPTSKDKDPEVYTRKALSVLEEMSKSREIILNVYEGVGFDIGTLRVDAGGITADTIQVGDVFEMPDGSTLEFMGGDPNDRSNYQEVQ
jgi:hypothetical protein